MIAIGRDSVSSASLLTFDNAGNAGWTADHGARIYGMASDSAGNIYSAGERISSVTTRKYNSAGSLQWSVDHGATVFAVAADGAGNVYTGGVRTSSVTTRKYNSSGSLQWSVDHGATVTAITVDGSGNVYTVGVRSSSITTRKYNSSGTLQWSADHGQNAYGITLDSDGNVYTVGVKHTVLGIPYPALCKKYDNDGSFIEDICETPDDINCVAVDAAGNIYLGCTSVEDQSIQKYDSTGDYQWGHGYGYDVTGVAVDGDGNVYTSGDAVVDGVARKYASDGTLIWEVGGTWRAYGITYSEPPLITLAPALAISIALAIPFQTSFVAVPPLALGLALGIPSPSTPPLAPLGDGMRIYRAYLTDAVGELLALPIASLQCTRRYNESTWVSVTAGLYSEAWRVVFDGRIGKTLVVNTGFRSAAGVETLGLFLRATITEWAYERSAGTATITITGRVDPTAYTNQARTLTGIRSRTTDNDRWEVVCDIDPLLRPHDTVTAGDLEFLVGAVQYRISTNDAVMTVTEAL